MKGEEEVARTNKTLMEGGFEGGKEGEGERIMVDANKGRRKKRLHER